MGGKMSIPESFSEDGFLVFSGILTERELFDARAAVDRLHQRALSGGEAELTASCVLESALPASKRGGVEVEEGQNAAFIVGDPSRFEPFFLSLFLKPSLTGLVRGLLANDDIVMHFANITTKASAIGSGIAWHRDFPNEYICPETPVMLRTMICLDGMDEANGATTFLRGSHSDGKLNATDIGANNQRISMACCGAGDLVAIHPLVLHGGGPNHSSRPRRNIVIQWGIRGAPMQTTAMESVTGVPLIELASLQG
jgi:hypothetical protein